MVTSENYKMQCVSMNCTCSRSFLYLRVAWWIRSLTVHPSLQGTTTPVCPNVTVTFIAALSNSSAGPQDVGECDAIVSKIVIGSKMNVQWCPTTQKVCWQQQRWCPNRQPDSKKEKSVMRRNKIEPLNPAFSEVWHTFKVAKSYESSSLKKMTG